MSGGMNLLAREIERRSLLYLFGLAGIGAGVGMRLFARSSAFAPRLRALAARWVGPGKLPGLVVAIGLPGREPRFIAEGSEGFTDFDPMSGDTLFRIYSMTKPITGMAAMMLIDEGRLGLDQPLAEIIPDYARMRVQDHYDGSLSALHLAPRPITIRHLLTHTSGLSYSIVQTGPIRALLEQKGLVPGRISRLALPFSGFGRGPGVGSLAAFAKGLAQVPLVSDPGTRWSYSAGLDLMGRVIEIVAGMGFEEFLRDRLLGPVGMQDTYWQVPASEAHRLATNHALIGGRLVPIDSGDRSIFLDRPPFACGGAGLVSTPRDYDRFLRMLAQGGTIDGRRVMSEAAVRTGTANLLPPGIKGEVGFAPNSGFGAGGRVGLAGEAGIFGWSGAAGTVAMVDMKSGLRSQFYAQFMPSQGLNVLSEFQAALKADITTLLEAPNT